MHKKLESDLISLAHRILKMKNKEDVFALKEISRDVFEKLSMLAFVEEFVNTTPNLDKTKEELLNKVEDAFEAKINKTSDEVEAKVDDIQENINNSKEQVTLNLVDDKVDMVDEVSEGENKEQVVENNDELKSEEISEQPFDELQELMFGHSSTDNLENDTKDVADKKTLTLEEELQDTLSVDVMADLFENTQPKSLNDRLTSNIQIGLNDRIIFVKNLFEGDQENYNRVISQLNTFKTEKEAKKFINKMVKPDYNWLEYEDLENRFMEIISRKFS